LVANNDAQLRRREQPLFAADLNLNLSKTGNYSQVKDTGTVAFYAVSKIIFVLYLA
jgi:uncharacterized MAPEG superfamily protein